MQTKEYLNGSHFGIRWRYFANEWSFSFQLVAAAGVPPKLVCFFQEISV